MRYVLLLLTLLTAGFSVWYYQNRISPEGKELATQKQHWNRRPQYWKKPLSNPERSWMMPRMPPGRRKKT